MSTISYPLLWYRTQRAIFVKYEWLTRAIFCLWDCTTEIVICIHCQKKNLLFDTTSQNKSSNSAFRNNKN